MTNKNSVNGLKSINEEAAITLLYGSMENFHQSSELEHVSLRALECHNLRNKLFKFTDDRLAKIPNWNLVKRTCVRTSNKILLTAILPQLQELQDYYAAEIRLPIKLSIARVDKYYNELMDKYPFLKTL